ncbi:MAG: TrbI/VirB10 family protein [Novosphingobium sp.]
MPAPVESPSAPAVNPQAFKLSGDPPRVMRLSRKTLAALGLVAGLGIGGSLLYALQSRHPVAAQNLIDTDSRNKADVVTAAPATYDKAPKLGPAMPGDLGRPILSAQQNGQMVPVPPIGSQGTSQPDPRLAAAQQARERIGQERDSARTSRLFLGGSGGTNMTADAASLPATTAPSVTANAVAADAGTPTGQAGKRAFLETRGNRVTVSAQRITAPASRNIIQAGTVIPAALITGIRSDLPGQITAQVTQNVYDSPTGRILLIPQGARLIGEYDSEVAAGQNRVLLAWDRLILPGGRSILLDRQPGADGAGMAGLQDRTNYHWGNMLKAAAISTMLGIGSELATDSDDSLTSALRYGTQDTVNQTGRQVVQRQINVPPTLTVRPGYPLRVILTRDLVLDDAESNR